MELVNFMIEDSVTKVLFLKKFSTEMEMAFLSTLEAKKLKNKILTPILKLENFYPSDQTLQDYYKVDNTIITRYGWIKQSKAYKYYQKGCR